MPVAPYSYRSDATVPKFDDTEPLMIFDGHCVLCSSGVVWMLAHDPQGACRFAVVQDPIPQTLYRHYGLDAENFETFLVLVDGMPYLRWAGWLAAARCMPAPWRWLGILGRVVPDGIGDEIYDWVQRNRFDWFGKRATCFLPDAAQKGRFLTEA